MDFTRVLSLDHLSLSSHISWVARLLFALFVMTEEARCLRMLESDDLIREYIALGIRFEIFDGLLPEVDNLPLVEIRRAVSFKDLKEITWVLSSQRTQRSVLGRLRL